ncbi:MAG TPA: UDP-3-O-(3-hydroxymyristoyl)glucosamine N-acyltransferase [Methylomirabilota bacterium]|nr:UDP-3-O-(3-hydroxymyristoyl)glucosamine N-acyltransferase [Methylomirabilota bacterium]
MTTAGRTLGELARLVGGEVRGDAALPIRGLAPLDQAQPGDLGFVSGGRYRREAEASRASALVVPLDFELPGRPLIRVAQPALAVATLLRVFHPEPAPVPGVHPTAVVADSARVAADATLLAFVVVGAGSAVESRAVLHPHVVVGERCRIGEASVLHPHVVLRGDVDIGRRVVIHAGAVLGADGFGYAFDGSRHQKIPQVGRVVVEDDVEIGANVTIDRATLGETVIGRGTKIDNLVQIGHNTVVGADAIIVAQTGISGSCRIGNRVVLGGQVGLADHVTIGDGAQVGSQSGVHRDVPAGGTALGSPAMPAAEARRAMAALPRLADLVRAARALERRLARVEERLGQEKP